MTDQELGIDPILSLSPIQLLSAMDRELADDLEHHAILGLSLLDLPPDAPPLLTRWLLNKLEGPLRPSPSVSIWTTTPINKAAAITEIAVSCSDFDGIQKGPMSTASVLDMDGWRLELLGRKASTADLVDPNRDDRITTFTMYRQNGQKIVMPVVIWRRRLYYKESNLYVESRWMPHRADHPDHIRYGGMEYLSHLGEIEHLNKGRMLLEGVVREISVGRAPEYDEANEPDFFEGLQKAVHATVRDSEDVGFSSLGRHWLLDRRTVKKYVELFGYDLKTLEAEAISCTKGRSICTVHVRRRGEYKKKRG